MSGMAFFFVCVGVGYMTAQVLRIVDFIERG